jgi:hypothetical protein
MWEPESAIGNIFTTHLARNFLLYSQTQLILVKYTMGHIQIKGMGTRQLSVRLRFILL